MWMSMSDPCRTWPVQTLPISRGRNRASLRIRRRASTRMSLRFSSRFGPSWIRAMAWIWSRISALVGRSPGRNRYSTPSCRAALRLAVKYSVSVRWYINWAARKAICRRRRSSAMAGRCADLKSPIEAAPGVSTTGRGCLADCVLEVEGTILPRACQARLASVRRSGGRADLAGPGDVGLDLGKQVVEVVERARGAEALVQVELHVAAVEVA